VSKKVDVLRRLIECAREESASEGDGEEEDLYNIILKTIKEWHTMGRDWVVDHYWAPYPDMEIARWRDRRK